MDSNIEYKKKYLKYKKKYLESKKIFHGGSHFPSPLEVAVGEPGQTLADMEHLAKNILDEKKITMTLRNGGKANLTLRDILDTDGIFDLAVIGKPQIDNIKEALARELSKFPVGKLANQLCLERHGVTADNAWPDDAFLKPKDNTQSQDIVQRIRNWLNEDTEYNSYSDIIKCILGRDKVDSTQIRHVLENKVPAQKQCARIIGEFVHPTPCYLCGIIIDTWHTGTPHCEHLLPVGQAVAFYWLARYRLGRGEHYPPHIKDFLRGEYKWSCSCCNRIKNDMPFVKSPDLATGAPFVMDDDKIDAFLDDLCDNIGEDDDWTLGSSTRPKFAVFFRGLPNEDKGTSLKGTETYKILCQRKKFQMAKPPMCGDDWRRERKDEIKKHFARVLYVVNHNFLRRGAAEFAEGTFVPQGFIPERAWCFVELAKIEMKIKIILALGDEGLVELFCENNAERRSLGLFEFAPNASTILVPTDPSKKKKRKEKRVAVKVKKARKPAPKKARKPAPKKVPKETPAEKATGPSPAWPSPLPSSVPAAWGPAFYEPPYASYGGKPVSLPGHALALPSARNPKTWGEIQHQVPVKEAVQEEAQEEVTIQEEVDATGLEKFLKKCISQRGFAKYLLFEILEEIIKDHPKDNIFILFVIDLLTDDEMNTLFFETFQKTITTQLGENEDEDAKEDAEDEDVVEDEDAKEDAEDEDAEEDGEDGNNEKVNEKTQLGKLINELTRILDDFEASLKKVEK